MGKGLLLSIEGIDGSGKTTIAKRVVEELTSRGIKAVYTFEPTDSIIGKIIRDEIFNAKKRPNPYYEVLLFAADRMLHVKNFIMPHLRKGYIVVSDRYIHSSIAYQGARGVSISWIRRVNKYAVKPGLAIYIDVTPEVGLSRKSGLIPTFENVRYLEKVRNIYLKLVEEGELKLIDGSKPIDMVVNDVLSLISKLIPI